MCPTWSMSTVRKHFWQLVMRCDGRLAGPEEVRLEGLHAGDREQHGGVVLVGDERAPTGSAGGPGARSRRGRPPVSRASSSGRRVYQRPPFPAAPPRGRSGVRSPGPTRPISPATGGSSGPPEPAGAAALQREQGARRGRQLDRVMGPGGHGRGHEHAARPARERDQARVEGRRWPGDSGPTSGASVYDGAGGGTITGVSTDRLSGDRGGTRAAGASLDQLRRQSFSLVERDKTCTERPPLLDGV